MLFSLADKTNNRLGVNEMLIASSVHGFLFGFVSGQPLMILGPTGPFLVFEEMVYDVSIYVEDIGKNGRNQKRTVSFF
jgi:MFS superfamily sulfate permease-like transporter